jgi:L-threonylcarbamoyladenylate synthase
LVGLKQYGQAADAESSNGKTPLAMSIIKVSDDAIRRAAGELKAGRLVAFPTETVYGLGADATSARAVTQIFEAKGRPRFNPLIVHVPDLKAAERIAEFPDEARRLARAFWPGPLTMVLKRRPDSGICDLVTAGLDTVAVRVPAHPVAVALLWACGLPLAGPSANRSGHVSTTTAAHVAADLGDKPALILDAGATTHGIESTVIDATGDTIRLLRPGATTREALEAVIGPLDAASGDITDDERPNAPGQLTSHYAPRARVRLNAQDIRDGEVLLAFGPEPACAAGKSVNLSPSSDLVEAATNLFAALRQLDAMGADTIAVMPIPEIGLGEAINDRLRRAAAER